MTARSISDEEISLIKGFLKRGMKNKDIQFFFNRPDRPVNSGRITNIRLGSYGNSRAVPIATDQELDKFLKQHRGKATVHSSDPISQIAVKAMFAKDSKGIWRLNPGETDQHECKTSFGFKYSEKWLKAIGALANNRGGYILFGVHDKGATDDKTGIDLSYSVCGLESDEFTKTEPVVFAKRIKSLFDPTPRIKITTLKIGGRNVGVIFVEQHVSRPVIAIKNEGQSICEGDIYFRYHGQTGKIKYSDLRAILDDRDIASRKEVLPMVERLLSLGPSRAMIADLTAGTLVDGKYSLQIDEKLIEKIGLLKEGEFNEKIGAPALKIIGNVQLVGKSAAEIKKGVITGADLLKDFLHQTSNIDGKEYIRFALEGATGAWFPLFYFASKENMTKSELIEFIRSTNAPIARKKKFIARVNNEKSAYTHASKARLPFLATLSDKTPTPTTMHDAANLAYTIQGLPSHTKISLQHLLFLLEHCAKLTSGTDMLSSVRRACCRVDEIFFRLKD